MAFTKRDIEKIKARKAAREIVHEPEIIEVGLPEPSPPIKRPFLRRRSVRLVQVVLFFWLLWFYFGGGLEHQAVRSLQGIKEQVAADQIKEYGIAKRNGSAMDACVMAGFTAAAFLQAQDERSYARWKATERSDCALAGISR